MDKYMEDVPADHEEESIVIGIFLCDLWRGFKKLWWVCLTLIAAFILAAFYIYYVNFTPLYTASATFTVHTQQINITGGGISSYTFYYNCIATLPQVNLKKYRWKTNKSILLNNPMVGYGFLEAFRAFRNSVIHIADNKSKVIMITSTAPGEGKTTIAINLASSIAKFNKKVLLIDGDLRKSNMMEILGIDKSKDIVYDKNMFQITQSFNYDFSLLTFDTDNYNLWQILNFENLNKILTQLRDKYDYIFIDTPPCGLMTDASIIAEVSDSAIYVVKQDMVLTSRIQNSLESLSSIDTKILGCVFNKTLSGFSGYGENYGYNDGKSNRYRYGNPYKYDSYTGKNGDKTK